MKREKAELENLLSYIATHEETIFYARQHLGLSIADAVCAAVKQAAKLERLRKATQYEPTNIQP